MKLKTDEGPSPREVLSANLRELMHARPELGTIKKVAEATVGFRLNGEDMHLSNGKVGRIAAASHTTDIDALHSLAKVFGLEPWQMLVKGLNPKALPRLVDATAMGELLDALQRSRQESVRKTTVDSPAHQVEKQAGRTLSPELKQALDVEGIGKSEAGKSGRISKPRARRGVQGTPSSRGGR